MYDCSCCQKSLPANNFHPIMMRLLEEARQLYLAVCDDCQLHKESKSLEEKCGDPCVEQKECTHCRKTLPLTDFSAVARRKRSWICWACQHPLCKGPGCNARQPIARVGEYMCDRCQFPACHVCKKIARPRSRQYEARNMPTWTCKDCHKCDTCGAPLNNYSNRSGRIREAGLSQTTCQKCLYPPCQCGAPRPNKSLRYSFLQLPTWRCSACTPAADQ